MIKRILPFVLVFAVLLSAMIIPMPVKADTGYSINLLDFTTISGQSNNTFSFNQSGSCTYNTASTLGEIRSYSFDIVFTWSGAKPTSFGLSHGGSVDFSVTSADLSSNMIRLTGSCLGYVIHQFVISMTSSGASYITFLRFDVALTSVNRVNLGTTLSVAEGSSAVMSPGGSVGVSCPTGIVGCVYQFSFPYSVWSAYDYIDFSGFFSNGKISTITASLPNGSFLPLSMSYIQDLDSQVFYYYSGRIDLTQGSLGSSGTLTVYITFDNYSNSGRLGLHGLSGVILGEAFDTQNTWYQILLRYMRSGFSSVVSGLQSVDGSIVDHMDLVDSWLDEINSNMVSWFNTLNTNIDTEFTNLKTKLQTEFTALKTALSTHFTNITNNLKTWFSDMQTLLTSKFDTVISKLQELIDGQPVDEGVTDDMQQSDNELGNMTDQMDQSTPDISVEDVNVSMGAIPDDGSSDLAFRFFDIFWSSSYLVSMLTTVIAISTVAFVFFGKR